ncbi:hypothetical protein CIB84_010867 [Bambusicola thoracicus]|uniref:Uncharacterized protein n=1 Tax=Bambusicola thoracicus TaxID=9083 RepID=A0A2P4SMQ0_BAMTH|nr:hypothetical protein CIB84_010867 [Bambusicola thoracicus]
MLTMMGRSMILWRLDKAKMLFPHQILVNKSLICPKSLTMQTLLLQVCCI